MTIIENQKVIMLVGVSGSGKSTFAKELAKKYCINKIFSSDEYRYKLLGSESDQSNNNLVFETMHKDIVTALNNGDSIIYDATNLSSRRRKHFIYHVAMKRKYKFEAICYVVPTTFSLACANNKKRDRQLDEDVIKRQCLSFQLPLYSEGWDEIVIKYNDNHMMSVNMVNAVMDYNQNNKYHTLTLGNHLYRTAELLKDEHYFLKSAGLLHDIGKPLSAEIKNDGSYGFYNHEKYSAMLSLLVTESTYPDEISSINDPLIFDLLYSRALLIQYHMEHYQNNEQRMLKIEKELGYTLYNALLKLNEADKKAH